MKFAVLAMVKNESDIIEAFVRHNLQFADELFILDNGSTDNTLFILQSLKNEGLPIHLYQDFSTGYLQQSLSTQLLHEVKKSTNADIFMFLDADEFICIHPAWRKKTNIASDKEYFKLQLAKIKEMGIAALKWLNFLPTQCLENDYINHFYEYSECDQSLIIHQKVIYTRDMIDYVILTKGNHQLIDKNTNSPIHQNVFQEIALAHFPVRSSEQAVSKVLTTAISVSSRKVSEGESFHIFEMRKKIAKNNYKISLNEQREMSRTYGIPAYYTGAITLAQGKINQNQMIAHRYLHLQNVSSLNNLYYLAESLAQKLQASEPS